MTLDGQIIVPVIVIDDAAQAVDLVGALLGGGIACAEITFRTTAAVDAIRATSSIAGFTVGAGTVLTTDDVDRAADAGARFVVSPGFAQDVVERSLERGLEVLPGVATATEVMRAARIGISRVKFFPAAQLGGPAAIAALSGPFPDATFLPSGGVTAENASDYLAVPAVFAVSGSWMATRALIADGAFTEIERRSRESVEKLSS
ncbi:bifunctional 4-hydroxy-2-oxoglutarate aldolase/2-dehydro-3-deoxy-phosphogluconate aldolase [Diaminobutyricibacter sp. McL0618]|uniref:bifunctional 4-hydroxy-2-oxoglutarate aldolase/2-dehydro-3-deoxy-phosphogluconate aldolase n=1 Tax=Leifsonia sp. McL0618 TaxID=3415677 RepID=UPI003CF7F371